MPGYLVIDAVFASMSPIVLDGVVDAAGEPAASGFQAGSGLRGRFATGEIAALDALLTFNH